jgi:DNA-binding NarL/FixJ family response regulator
MKHVLIASDSVGVREEVKAVLGAGEFTVREVSSGHDVLPAVAAQVPDLVVCDMQMGSKGGMATCLDLRLEESAARLPYVAVLLLVDRRPDVFLARRSEADGYLVKPLDPVRLRTAISAVLDGESYEDPSYRPAESAASAAAAVAVATAAPKVS